MQRVLPVLLLLFLLPCTVQATTWCEEDVTCPVCGTQNTFMSIMSYGGYIYHWPSKYEYVFWPLTETESIYSCKKCLLTCFLWDFEELPKEKHEAVRKALEGQKISGEFADYLEIPVLEKLALAEKVYQALDTSLDDWCRFYRVVGLHAASRADQDETHAKELREKAEAARRKALGLARGLLADAGRQGQAKENHLIAGAMLHLLGDDEGAAAEFEKGLELTYEAPGGDEERSKGLDEYLSGLLEDYLGVLENPPPPPPPADDEDDEKEEGEPPPK